MQLGMIGLGRMGANMVRRLERAGHECVGYDVDAKVVEALAAEGVAGATALEELVGQLDAAAPRLDHGAGRVRRLDDRRSGAAARARRHDHRRRQLVVPRRRRPRRPARRGPRHPLPRRRHERRHPRPRARLLPDGRRRRRRRRRGWRRSSTRSPPASRPPSARPPGREPASRRPGRAGLAALRPVRRRPLREDGAQRHRVRADGRLRRGPQRARQGRHRVASATPTTPRRRRSTHPEYYHYDLDLAAITEVWRRGSVVASWLLDLTADALAADPELDEFEGHVSDSGEGRWTITPRSTKACPCPCCRRRCTSASARAAAPTSPTRCCRRCAPGSAATPSGTESTR